MNLTRAYLCSALRTNFIQDYPVSSAYMSPVMLPRTAENVEEVYKIVEITAMELEVLASDRRFQYISFPQHSSEIYEKIRIEFLCFSRAKARNLGRGRL